MINEHSTTLLLVLLPVILALALRAPPYVLLLADLAFVFVPGFWILAGTYVDKTDMVFLGIAVALATHRGSRRRLRVQEIPYFGLWLAFGLISCVAYLYAPINQMNLTDPMRIAYQLYRYCWRPILYYPLTMLLLTDRKKLQAAMVTIVLVADVCALQGAWQGFGGDDATGPFADKNGLGGFLIMPLILSLSQFLYPQSKRAKQFFGASVLVLLRGLVSASSRGAFVATAGGIGFFLVVLATTTHGLSRVTRLAMTTFLLLLLSLAVRPDLLERPNVQHLLEATDPADVGNYQWRQEERWPYFRQKVLDNPWFGVGTDVDLTFTSCPTPHEGYLAVSLISGIPACIILVTFAALAGIREGTRVFSRGKDRNQQAIGLAVAASIIGLLIHNFVEATMVVASVMRVFWILAATAALLARRGAVFASEQAAAKPAVQSPTAAALQAPGLSPS